MACTFQDLELNNCKTVLNIKESKYGTWSQKTYKNCRLIDLKRNMKDIYYLLTIKKLRKLKVVLSKLVTYTKQHYFQIK